MQVFKLEFRILRDWNTSQFHLFKMRTNSIAMLTLMHFRHFFLHWLEENYLLQQILMSVCFCFFNSPYLDGKHFFREVQPFYESTFKTSISWF